MSQEFNNQIKAIVLGSILAFGVASVSAWTGPLCAPPSCNISAPLTALNIGQAKGKTSATSGSILDVNGNLSTNALGVSGDANILGNVTIPQFIISSGSSREMCVDPNGKVILC